MLNLDKIRQRIIERYRHIWIHKVTGEMVLSTDAYTFINGRRRTIEIDISTERGSRHARLEKFEKNHVYVCEGWKIRPHLKSKYE